VAKTSSRVLIECPGRTAHPPRGPSIVVGPVVGHSEGRRGQQQQRPRQRAQHVLLIHKLKKLPHLIRWRLVASGSPCQSKSSRRVSRWSLSLQPQH